MNYSRIMSFALLACSLLYSGCQRSEPTSQNNDEKKKTEEVQKTEEEKPKDQPKGDNPQEQPEDNKSPEGDKPQDQPEDNKNPEGDKPKEQPKDNKSPEEDKPKEQPEDNKSPEGDKPKEQPEDNKSPEGDKPKEQPEPPKEDTSPEYVKSNVLLIDFTGQYCHNCYQAANALNSTVEGSQGFIIGVAMHGYEPMGGNLLHPTAKLYHKHFLPARGVPNYVFNNIPQNKLGTDEMIKKADVINAKISSRLISNQKLEFEFSSVYRRGQEKTLAGKSLNLLFWVTEDNVIASQRNITGEMISNYKHNHVFRGVLGSDTWGRSYTVGSVHKGSYELPQSLGNKANAHLIALIIDSNTKEVYDVMSVPLLGQ